MSTRGVIARLVSPGKFKGRYHHWDSYIKGLGASLHELYHTHFNKDIDTMLKTLIDDHPAGWSTICGRDWTQEPRGEQRDDLRKKQSELPPECFCHGDRKEEGCVFTEENASGSGCEYAYAFTKGKDGHNLMVVLSSYRKNGNKMIGMFGCGDENAAWREIGTVDLDSEIGPDWEAITEAVFSPISSLEYKGVV